MKAGLVPGSVVLLFGWGLYSGLRDQDHLLVWASSFVFLVLLWCLASVLITAVALSWSLSRSEHPPRIDGAEGEESLTGFHLRMPAWLPLTYFASTLNGQETHFTRRGDRFAERATFPRRRLQPTLQRSLVISDFLDLTHWTISDRWLLSLRILPQASPAHSQTLKIGMVTGADLPDPYSAETGDRHDMRRYRRGDPLRLVLWSIYQRSGHLMVRAPEKAMSQHQRTGLYLFTSGADGSAAALARDLVETDALGGGWRFGADGRISWADNADKALDLLAESGNEDPEMRVHQFLFDLARDRFGKCLILLAPDPENHNDKLVQLAHGARLPSIGIEIWVVYDAPNVPTRNSFPTVAGTEMHLIERSHGRFKMVAW